MSGVDASRAARGGKAFDIVVLPSMVMGQLESEGWIIPGTLLDIARSGIAVAVRSGSPRPAIETEADLKQAILKSGKISYSSGPSGDHLKRLFQRWDIAETIADRIVEAKPGIPVAQLVARGEADLGFQQLSEFLDIDGIDVVGPLPSNIQAITTFTAGVGSAAAHPDDARVFAAYLVSPETIAAKRRSGMEAAS